MLLLSDFRMSNVRFEIEVISDFSIIGFSVSKKMVSPMMVEPVVSVISLLGASSCEVHPVIKIEANNKIVIDACRKLNFLTLSIINKIIN